MSRNARWGVSVMLSEQAGRFSKQVLGVRAGLVMARMPARRVEEIRL